MMLNTHNPRIMHSPRARVVCVGGDDVGGVVEGCEGACSVCDHGEDCIGEEGEECEPCKDGNHYVVSCGASYNNIIIKGSAAAWWELGRLEGGK